MDKKNLGSESIQIQWRINDWFKDLPDDQLTKFKIYFEELQKFNKTINLVSIKTLPVADAVHFADSIIAATQIFNSKKISEIYDFGSGNGFPGIVIAIMHPETSVQVVDVDQRKAEFVKHIASHLKLSNVKVLVRPVDSLPESSVSFAISRGFASISKAILLARKCMKSGGEYYHMKSEEWATEVGAIPTQLCSYWTPTLLSEYKLPVGNVKFSVVITHRLNQR